MAPVLLGILVAIAVAITELAIVNFEDTPLGRLLVAVELFAFLVHAFSSELKHPYRDSFSFEPSRTVPRDSEGRMGFLPTLSVSTFRATPPNMRNSQRSMRNGLQPSSSVYTGPVIRRGSHAPSWESEVLRTGKYASLPDRASIVSEKSSQLKEDVDVLNTSLESFPEPESPMDVEPQRRGHRRIATRDLPSDHPDSRRFPVHPPPRYFHHPCAALQGPAARSKRSSQVGQLPAQALGR
jgi:hypothetical protein